LITSSLSFDFKRIFPIFLTLIILCSPVSLGNPIVSDIQVSIIPNEGSTQQNNEEHNYVEHVTITVAPDGDYQANLGIIGNDFNLGLIDFDTTLSENEKNIFKGLHLLARSDLKPEFNYQNIYMYIIIMTDNLNTAEIMGQAIIEELQTSLNFNADLVGHRSFMDFNLNEEIINHYELEYIGVIDYNAFISTFQSSLPTEKGGLANDIDATDSDTLGLFYWNERSHFSLTMFAGFHDTFENQSGGHEFSIMDAIGLNILTSSPLATGDMLVQIWLPNVTNPVISTNPENLDIGWNYTESSSADFLFYNWEALIWIPLGTQASVIDLSFDFDFIQANWVATEKYYWTIDPRGFDRVDLQVFGRERVAPTENMLAESHLFENVTMIKFDMNRANQGNLFFRVAFNGHMERDIEYQNILTELSNVGIDFTTNSSQETWFGHWFDERFGVKQRDYEVTWYVIVVPINETLYKSIIQNFFTFDKSDLLQFTDLNNFELFSWNVFPGKWGAEADIHLGKHSYNTDKHPSEIPRAFPLTETSHNADLLKPFLTGWDSTLPWSEHTERIEIHFSAPYTGSFNNIQFTPLTARGEMWSSTRQNYQDHRFDYFFYTIYIDSENPKIIDGTGAPIGDANEFKVSWTNEFVADDQDIDYPRVQDFYFRNKSVSVDFGFGDDRSWSKQFHNQNFDGNIKFLLKIDDLGPYGLWHNKDTGEWLPKFPSSGISEVLGYFAHSEYHMEHPLFKVPMPFDFQSLWPEEEHLEAWLSEFDTTNIPDGEWDFFVRTEDNHENTGYFGLNQITIQNYKDTQPVQIIPHNDFPIHSSTIAGEVKFEFTVQDDIGIYAVVFTENFNQQVLTPTNTITNSSGVFNEYSYTIDTALLEDNFPLFITIDALDFDGHIDSYSVRVVAQWLDTIAPEISIISPIAGESYADNVNIELQVVDNVKVSEVKLKLPTRESETEVQPTYIGNDKYIYLWDINDLRNGEVEIVVEAKDSSNNINSETITIRINNIMLPVLPFGLNGFNLYLGLLSILIIVPIYRLTRRDF
jgi:hypothetical protein